MDGWTIDELAQRVTKTLAEQGVRAPSGRVTAVPDRRLIRWYTTIGLLDRPLPTRGRAARYGQRHLLQLIAVKRRQAEGRTLAEIQAELAGATDATLRRAAGFPEHADDATPSPAAGLSPAGTDRDGFWRATATAGAGPAPDPSQNRRPLYRPVRILDAPDHPAGSPPADRPASPPAAAPVYPVPLHDAAALVLFAAPTAADLAAIHTAARPLLDLLADRGLLLPEPPPQPGRPQ
jgi:hypothetical protein